MLQVSVASDGRVKAVFADNHVLALSPGGTLFAYISDNGRVVRQNSAFVVSQYAQRLCAVLEFRNMHIDQVAWCRAMTKRHASSIFTTGYPISSVTWPSDVKSASDSESVQVRVLRSGMW
jgi:hypothetical protein